MEEYFTEENEKTYGQWKEFVRGARDVIIAPATIPYGFTVDAKEKNRVRRLSYEFLYLGVQPDGNTLEDPRFGTRESIAAINSNLLYPPLLPDGTKNEYYGIGVQRFPAAIHLANLPPLCEAILGRASWDDPSVIEQASVLLMGERAEAEELIRDIRKVLKDEVLSKWPEVERAERQAFGHDSHFAKNDANERLFLKSNLSGAPAELNLEHEAEAEGKRVIVRGLVPRSCLKQRKGKDKDDRAERESLFNEKEREQEIEEAGPSGANTTKG
jgi:hypothetical protein